MNSDKDIGTFSDNCKIAANCFLMFEAALPTDRINTIKRIKSFSQPRGLEKEWLLVIKMCVEFERTCKVELNDYPIPLLFGFEPPVTTIYDSNQFSSLLRLIAESDFEMSVSVDTDSPIQEQSSISQSDEQEYKYNSMPHPNQFLKNTSDVWDSLKSKEQILDSYQLYIARLDDAIKSIKALKANNRKFEQIQNNCLDKIQGLLDASRAQMNQVMNETIWDKLVIAFFGETNAGKSTIIETFRIKFNDSSREEAIKKNNGEAVDGLIVGDGRSDFTQIYETYYLNIDDKPFVLIDVPGIEGKEANYLEEIGKALKQAHCVFYVQGHNTKPNAATAEKIKGFLTDWVNVYSIYNVRGGTSNYDEDEERELLMTTDKLEREKSIIEVFEGILPGIYKGNVSCQGLLALLSIANFHKSRTDLIRNQCKIVEYFGSSDKVWEFSRFSDVEQLVRSQSSDFSKNIVDANRNKLQSLTKRIVSGLSDILEEQSKMLDAYDKQLTSFKNSVSSSRNDVLSLMRQEMNSEVTQALVALRRASNDIIDNGRNTDEWSQRLEDRTKSIQEILEQSIRDIYKNGIEDFYERIEAKRKDLDKIKHLKLNISEVNLDININLSGILKELTLSFKEAVGDFFNSLLNPIGTVIKLIKNRDDGREEAKRKAGEEIEKLKRFIMNEIGHILDEIILAVKQAENPLNHSIELEKRNIENLKREIVKLKNDFCA